MTASDFRSVLAETLGMDDSAGPAEGARLEDLEVWDSMGQIQVLAMIEERFDVVLDMDELLGLRTVDDLVDVLRAKGIAID